MPRAVPNFIGKLLIFTFTGIFRTFCQFSFLLGNFLFLSCPFAFILGQYANLGENLQMRDRKSKI
jgi:hypothetical protein